MTYDKIKNSTNPNLTLRDDLFCRYCNRQCKNLNSLKQHECRCKLNPNRIKVISHAQKGVCHIPIERRGWSKGLSKDNDPRLKKLSEQLKIYYCEHDNHQKGVPRTPQEKQKISETMKLRGCGGIREHSGRGHKGWYKGYFCDSTYELAYVVYNLDHNIPFNRCSRDIYYLYEYKGKTHKYYPDFILADGSLVEVKGYHSEDVDLKIASVTDRPIKVLYEQDLQYAFDYVFSKYTINKLEDLYE